MKTINESYAAAVLRNLGLALGLGVLALGSAGCNKHFKVSNPPEGFVEVNRSSYLARYKALDNVGMNVRAFDNHEGGTMAYWSGDLLKKLAERGYTKTGEGTLKSANGVTGQRYDFDYAPPGGPIAESEAPDDASGDATSSESTEGLASAPKFYTVVLFVTKKNIVVVELAGDSSLAGDYRQRVGDVAKELRVK
jgi:hypothetical protein